MERSAHDRLLYERAAIAEGNIAGLAAIIGALLKSLPPEQVPAFRRQANAEFEHLEAGMLASDDRYSEFVLQGMRNSRELLDDSPRRT